MGKTGGNWNPEHRNLYFIVVAASHLWLAADLHPHMLVALNELEGASGLKALEKVMERTDVLIDSGVFSLASAHAMEHCLTMDEARALPPDEVGGFQNLYKNYCRTLAKLGDHSWGYIEIDQGGREHKRRTRAKLEALGLRPIPVYHPFYDGWDYFDELAGKYDRICIGNMVHANSETRKRMLATLHQRKRSYPGLWLHVLGITPNEWLNAFPMDSCDSSAWYSQLRWNDRIRSHVCCKVFSPLYDRTTYDYGADPASDKGYNRAIQLAAYDAAMLQRCWRGLLDEVPT